MCLRSDGGRYEKLGSIGILPGVCHTKQALLAMLQFEVLIGKLITVDRLSTRAWVEISEQGVEDNTTS